VALILGLKQLSACQSLSRRQLISRPALSRHSATAGGVDLDKHGLGQVLSDSF
jgi:nucleoside recognition membrane protein YjiH